MTLKDLIIEYRNDHGLSQRQFATACGLSNGYISMLEKEMNPNTKLPVTPTLPKLKQLASGMGMSLTDLLVKVDDMPVELVLDDADSKKLVPEIEDELDAEIMKIISGLTPEKKQQALSYIQYLAQS
ncbi:MAG TPA: helix-turn-helix domain-containing protein [Oscillospiraceae bacterium]|jgi:transcriptional regulator with XRE-family HTH domain|nr:helix-turn-helix domain-containing protein [Oscillospiraceae bacterium]